MIFELYWSPEGRPLCTVESKDARTAKRKAPQPYRKYQGELYALVLQQEHGMDAAMARNPLHRRPVASALRTSPARLRQASNARKEYL